MTATKKTKTYAIAEIFHTIQGEGHHVGTTAVFIRFAVCNLWSGNTADRKRDSIRHGARCPEWCDTDFQVREILTVEEIVARVAALPGAQMIVLTGGEPLLQVDFALVKALSRLIELIAVETNGTKAITDALRRLLWVTLSPKVAPALLMCGVPDEIKVVFPDYDPLIYLPITQEWTKRFVQPRAACDTKTIGKSSLVLSAMSEAAAFVMAHPEWRLSLQTHKMIGLP